MEDWAVLELKPGPKPLKKRQTSEDLQIHSTWCFVSRKKEQSWHKNKEAENEDNTKREGPINSMKSQKRRRKRVFSVRLRAHHGEDVFGGGPGGERGEGLSGVHLILRLERCVGAGSCGGRRWGFQGEYEPYCVPGAGESAPGSLWETCAPWSAPRAPRKPPVGGGSEFCVGWAPQGLQWECVRRVRCGARRAARRELLGRLGDERRGSYR